jgi:biotin synthase
MQAAGVVFKLLDGKDRPKPVGPTREEALAWLKEKEAWKLDFLWEEADRVRREHVGDEVHLRGLIELSNYCRCDCLYCGIRASRRIERYRMTADEVMDCARTAQKLEYGTVVLQSGEDLGLTTDFITSLIRRVKNEAGLAVTLSLGERSREEFAKWREAGADRYLLKHETSDQKLFRRIHPDVTYSSVIPSEPRAGAGFLDSSDMAGPSQERALEMTRRGESRNLSAEPSPRVELLKQLREFGYEIGSGVMVGIPGQSYESLADDIMLFRDFDMDMVGSGPFVPHPRTPLGRAVIPLVPTVAKPHERRPPERFLDSSDSLEMTRRGESRNLAAGSQVPATDTMTTKVVALTRLACPDANIPSTTALATVNREHGRELGLERGANVWMPNLTPPKYRTLYEIYPGKAAVTDMAAEFHQNLLATLERIGRVPGKGPGGRRRSPA